MRGAIQLYSHGTIHCYVHVDQAFFLHLCLCALQSTFQSEPYDIQFYHLKTDSKSSEETTVDSIPESDCVPPHCPPLCVPQVSLVIGHKTLFLYDMDNADNPVELAFQPRYGEIVAYKWCGEAFACVAYGLSHWASVIVDLIMRHPKYASQY